MRTLLKALNNIALTICVTFIGAFAPGASAAPTYMTADFSGGLFSVTTTFRNRLTAAGYDPNLFVVWSGLNPTPVNGHLIFDAAVPVPPSGTVNVFSIGAIPAVSEAAIFEFNIDGITLHFGDAGIQGGPAIQYKDGAFNGFFFVEDFLSPNGTPLQLSVQGGAFNVHLQSSPSAFLFTGFLNVGAGGLTNVRNFDPSSDVPEPGVLALLGLGMLTLIVTRHRRQRVRRS